MITPSRSPRRARGAAASPAAVVGTLLALFAASGWGSGAEVAVAEMAAPGADVAREGRSGPLIVSPVSADSVRAAFWAAGNASPYVRWLEHGRTHEGQPLGYAIVGSREHLADLDGIRAGIADLGDPRRRLRSADLERLRRDLPAVVWMTFSVHGNELSPADVACRLLDQLTAEDLGEDRPIRDSLLVLIDPLRNPDGRERALAGRQQWESRVPVADDQSFHHRELWPGGRGNHYFVDLNRDAWQLSQPETRLRVREISTWQPQVVIDLHEMRSNDTYLFSPPRPPLPPSVSRNLGEWWDRFAHAIALAMSAEHLDYYRGDWHESFEPDRLVSWALHTGAVAMLLEVPGVDGGAVHQPNEAVLTFEETIDRHLLAARAILRTAAHQRRALLDDFRAFREHAVSGGAASSESPIPLCGPVEDHVVWLTGDEGLPVAGAQLEGADREPRATRDLSASLLDGRTRAVVLPPAPNVARLRKAVQILMRQGIEIGITEAAARVRTARDRRGENRNDLTFPAGSYVIDLHQPLGALAATLLDAAPVIDEAALLEERRSLVETGETTFYSYTAWSLPHWADLDVWYVPAPVGARLLNETGSESPPEPPHPARAEGAEAAGNAAEGWSGAHALLLDAADDATAAAAFQLLARGLRLRAASRAFQVGGRGFAAGSLILPIRPELSGAEVERICEQSGAHVVPTVLALTDVGPDLGSRQVATLALPRIALLTGFGVSAQALGRIWHLLDHEMQAPVSLVPIQRISRADLLAYNVIILPDAPAERGPRLREIVGAAGWNRLVDWVSFGGTLILCGESIAAVPRPDEGEARVHIGLRREVLEQIPWLRARRAEEHRSRDLLDLAYGTLQPEDAGWRPEGSSDAPSWGPNLLWALPEAGSPEEILSWDERQRTFAPQGMLMRLQARQEHWLMAGLGKAPAVPVSTRQVYHALGPAEAVARFASRRELCACGLLWPEAARRWEDSGAILRERIGSGQVIAIAGDFKRGSPVLDRVVLNAVLLGPALGARQSESSGVP